MIDFDAIKQQLPALPEGEYWSLVVDRALSVEWLRLYRRRSRRWWFDKDLADCPVTSPLQTQWYEMSDDEIEDRIINTAEYMMEQAQVAERQRVMHETLRPGDERRLS